MTSALPKSDYLEKLKERLDFAGKYNELTRQQEKALADDDADALLASIKERGKLIEAIDKVSAEIASLEETGANKSGSREMQEVTDRTKALFSEALSLDKKNAAALGALMTQTSQQGKNIAKSRDGIGKYAQKGIYYPPGYIDQRQ